MKWVIHPTKKFQHSRYFNREINIFIRICVSLKRGIRYTETIKNGLEAMNIRDSSIWGDSVSKERLNKVNTASLRSSGVNFLEFHWEVSGLIKFAWINK